jgi:hypothetical protein
MNRFFSVLAVLAVLVAVPGALVAWWAVRALEMRTVYRPEREVRRTPGDLKIRFQEVEFLSQDGVTQLHGWWIPAVRARGTVVYCHGNGGNIGDYAGVAADFNGRRLNLLLWDYRGYGKSLGVPGERGIRQDAMAAYEVAAEMAPELPIVIYGFSLGGAVAARLAADRAGCEGPAPAGLVVESSFASARDVGKRWHPHAPLWMMQSRYDSTGAVARLEGLPKLFGHSRDDSVLPWETGRLLFEAAAEPKEFAELEGDHLDSSWRKPGGAGFSELEAFLERVTEGGK